MAAWLRLQGYEVLSIYDEAPGIADEDILEIAFREDWIIITCDKDFGELIFKNNLPHKGVVLLRLHNETTPSKIKVLKTLLEQIATQLTGNFTVATESGIRISRS